MKITVLFLLAFTLQATAKGQERISITVTDAPLEQVFNSIRSQTGISFLYRPQYVKDKKVSMSVSNASLVTVLDRCLQGQELTYEVVGKSVAIRPVWRKGVSDVASPPIDVRGRVVNEKGEPVEGVTVTVKGSKISTTTKSNGEFLLDRLDAGAVLVFTHVGLETLEIYVKGREDLAISLKTKINSLGELTVTVNTGYQQLPKERATGSFEFISNDELNRKAGIDILSRIEGVATGILFDRRSNNPNNIFASVQNILIRGLNTMSEPIRAPLIVIDNFPYDGDISNINPNDVENITILKDAAAASIWGAKAGNGVIVITTKRGKANQPIRISANVNSQLTERPDLFKYSYMSAADFLDVERFLFNQGYFNSALQDARYPSVSPAVEIMAKNRSGLITSQQATMMIDSLAIYDVRSDFRKYVYRVGINNQYALNISGGGTNFQYYLSGGYDKSNTTLRGDGFQRITFRTMNTLTPFKSLEVNTSIAFTDNRTTNNSLGNIGSNSYDDLGSNRKLYPYGRLSDDSGNYLSVARNYRQVYTDTAGSGKLLDWKFRPLQELNNNDNTTQQQDIVANIGANYKLFNPVNVQFNYQYQRTNGLIRRLYNENIFYTRDLINLFSEVGSSVKRNIPLGGVLDQYNFSIISNHIRGQLNFNKLLSSDHQFSGIVGGELRSVKRTSSSGRQYGFNSETYTSSLVDYINAYRQYGNRGSAKIPSFNGSTLTTDHFVSIFANTAYTYREKYVLSASVRRDASNLFGVNANDKWKPFWTLGGAWDLSKEAFFKSKTISFLKIRASYGYQGNVNNTLSPYAIIGYQNASTNFINEPWAVISTPANSDLGWEKIGQLNIGMDIRVYNERVGASVDIYRKNATNLLWDLPIDISTGVGSVKANNAKMSGRGIDLSINTKNTIGVVRWTSEIGYSYISNKVTDYALSLDNNLTAQAITSGDGMKIRGVKNKSPYAVFSFPFAGLDASNGDPLGYQGKQVSSNYLSVFNQSYDTANVIYHGSAIPTSFGFVNNIVSFKSLSLAININYRLGYYFRRNTISYYSLINAGVTNSQYAKRWQAPGDEMFTTVPSLKYTPSDQNRDIFYAQSSANVLRGDNVRIQNIRLSYSVNNHNAKFFARSIQIYGNIENIGIIWSMNKDGLDPDYNTGNAYFPVPRTFTLGTKIDL